MKKIVITGPESSGKTTLAKHLSKRLNAILVPEYARFYLEMIDKPYGEDDLVNIAKGQLEWNAIAEMKNEPFIIYDTSMLVLKIWSEEKFNNVHPVIQKSLDLNHVDLYILCKPDIEWQQDKLRENPSDRPRLFKLYKASLESMDASYIVVSGTTFDNRFSQALKEIVSLK